MEAIKTALQDLLTFVEILQNNGHSIKAYDEKVAANLEGYKALLKPVKYPWKTLLIAGTYQPDGPGLIGVRYNVTLYGQTQDKPLMQHITHFNEILKGYDELQEVSRAKFAKYFGVDLFNIISMEQLTRA